MPGIWNRHAGRIWLKGSSFPIPNPDLMSVEQRCHEGIQITSSGTANCMLHTHSFKVILNAWCTFILLPVLPLLNIGRKYILMPPSSTILSKRAVHWFDIVQLCIATTAWCKFILVFKTSFNKSLGGNSTSHHQQQQSCHKARYIGSVQFPCASPHKSIACTNVATASKHKSNLVRHTQQVLKPLLLLQELIILSWQSYALRPLNLQNRTKEQFLQYNAITLISFSA